MADEETYAALGAQLEQVWKRVTAPPECCVLPLGDDSAPFGGVLCASIRTELAQGQTLTQLGWQNSVYVRLAAQSLRRARRLAAAWYLISGTWYLPQEAAPGQLVPPRPTLRRLYRSTQQAYREYSSFAATCPDNALCTLARELAEEQEALAVQLRERLECS